MLTLLLVLRLAIAAILATAAIAKLVDRSGARDGLVQFGVPPGTARWAAPLLPLAELGTAVLLVPGRTAPWGAAAALVLLLAFTLAVAYQLARGRSPSCRCFGQLSAAPVGRGTLLRNAALTSAAGLVLWGGGGPGLVDTFGKLPGEQLLVLSVLLLLLPVGVAGGGLLFHAVRQQGRLLLRIEALEAQMAARPAQSRPGLPADSVAPEFRLRGADGREWTLEALRADGTPLVLVFVDPSCHACTSLLPEVRRWQREAAGRLALAVITRGSASEVGDIAPVPVLSEPAGEVSALYRVAATPSAVGIRADGTIGAPLVEGSVAIREMVAPLLRSTEAVAAGNGRPGAAG
jgi:peroxiredoxin